MNSNRSLISQSISTLSKVCFLALAICALLLPAAVAQSGDEDHKPRHLSVLNHVTGWSLDTNGYHPAVFMLLENISGRDLSGQTIKMQGKFTDIHTLEPSTAKLEIRRAIKPHQQFPVALIAPQGYELPRDPNFWPVMESKVMMRVGTAGDEGTEYLLVTKIDSVTATQETAFQNLNEVTSYNRPTHHQTTPAHNPPRTEHVARPDRNKAGRTTEPPRSEHIEPLVATANKIQSPPVVRSGQGKSKLDLLTDKNVPGLGADFYHFENSFGLPVLTDAKKKDFTWAKYRQVSSGTDIIVASKERTGKADLIAFLVPRTEANNDSKLVERLKVFAGTNKVVKLSPPNKSVRYLPAGRLELTTSSAPGLKIVCMSVPQSADHPASTLVMITRLASDPDEVLRSHASSNEVLNGLPLIDPNSPN